MIFDNSVGWGLFDLLEDPRETNNMYDKPPFAAVQARLKAELDKSKASATQGLLPIIAGCGLDGPP